MGNINIEHVDDTKDLSQLHFLLKNSDDNDMKMYIQRKIDIINKINNNIRIAEIHKNRRQRSKLYEILDKSGGPIKMETLYTEIMDKNPDDYFKHKKVKSINKLKKKSKAKRGL